MLEASQQEVMFDDLEVGRSYPPYRFTPSRADRDAHAACAVTLGLRRADGALVAPDGAPPDEWLSPLMLNTFKALRAAIRMPDGVLHAREQITLVQPVAVDVPLAIVLTVTEKYSKNDKRFVVMDHVVTRESDGARIMSFKRRLAWPR